MYGKGTAIEPYKIEGYDFTMFLSIPAGSVLQCSNRVCWQLISMMTHFTSGLIVDDHNSMVCKISDFAFMGL